MNGPVRQQNDDREVRAGRARPAMSRALIVSVVLHIAVVVIVMVGIPHFRNDHKIPESISVELATVADITQSTKPPVKAPEPPEKKEEPPTKAVKPVTKSNPSKTPPKPVDKKPEPPKKPVEVTKETPEVDELAPSKKPEKKPEKKPDVKKTEHEEKQFDSLLKNLTKEPETPQSDIGDITKKLTAPTPAPETPNMGEQLTVSDIDALRQQLGTCWNVFAGAAEAEDLSVEIRLIINADRTVQNATIVDMARYNSDDHYRAVAESALRAVRDPRCSPLKLPEGKYNLWRDTIVNFNPKDMF